jgi:hypothetical protein
MAHNLSRLTSEELHDLFLMESHHFSEGIDNGLTFDELKEIRVKLRQITEELKSRKAA